MRTIFTLIRRIRWVAVFSLYGLVTFGLSRIFFGLIDANPDHFPHNAGFRFWFLVWSQLIPLLFLYSCDSLIYRGNVMSVRFRLWRSLLYTATALSLLRQFQIFEHERYLTIFGFHSPVLIAVIICEIVFLASFWASRAFETYTYCLGICSLILPVIFLIRTERPPQNIARMNSPAVRTISHEAPIIFILFDELSLKALTKNDQIDAGSFPNFATLSRQSWWFRNATTNHWLTIKSIPSLLTGKEHPEDNAETLFQLVPPGYNSTLILSEMEVENWLHSRPGDQRIDHYRGKAFFMSNSPFIMPKYLAFRLWSFWNYHSAIHIIADSAAYHVSLPEQAEKFEEAIKQPKPLIFWHISVPHSPFLFLPDGQRRSKGPYYFPMEDDYNPADFNRIFRNYHDQVQYADSVLGRILSDLRKTGLYDKAILIVTSDHGLRVWGDLPNNPEFVARIPMFMRFPEKSPEVIDWDFQLIDIVPTLLQEIGCPVPANLSGTSAFATLRPTRYKIVHFYPDKVAYDLKTRAWIATEKVVNARNPLATFVTLRTVDQPRTYSATQATDDLLAARERHEDFLARYLSRHFPTSPSETDLLSMHNRLKDFKSAKDSPAKFFRLGVTYFFLALAETEQCAEGDPTDVKEVNEHWNTSIESFQQAPEIGAPFQQEITKLLKESDTDGNHFLSSEELKRMIHSRR